MEYVSHEDFLKHTEQDAKEFKDASDERKRILREVLQRLDSIDQKLDPDSGSYILKEVNQHMVDVQPIVKEYQDKVALEAAAVRLGNRVKWIAGIITAGGVIYFFIKGVIRLP